MPQPLPAIQPHLQHAFPALSAPAPLTFPFGLCTCCFSLTLKNSFYLTTPTIHLANSYSPLKTQIKSHSLQEVFPDPFWGFCSSQTSSFINIVTLPVHCLSFHQNVKFHKNGVHVFILRAWHLMDTRKYLLNR